jgi:hypothetical protein
VWLHIWILYSVPLVFMSVFVPVPCFKQHFQWLLEQHTIHCLDVPYKYFTACFIWTHAHLPVNCTTSVWGKVVHTKVRNSLHIKTFPLILRLLYNLGMLSNLWNPATDFRLKTFDLGLLVINLYNFPNSLGKILYLLFKCLALVGQW